MKFVLVIVVAFAFLFAPTITYAEEIPSWIKNNAGWWATGQIDDVTFIQSIQYLIKAGILKINSDNFIDKTLPGYLFKTYYDKNNIKFDGTPVRYIHDLKPEGSELYAEYTSGISNHAVVFPSFTNSAYTSSGFYDYYRGDCNEKCLTINLRYDFKGIYESSNSAWQILQDLGYVGITDIDIDKNPKILNNYKKIILLHNEYVTQKEFDAITSHPNVIYLYPNALYGKVNVDYDTNSISLVRGHGYPNENITNGFDWEFDNTRPYELDSDCDNWEFYQIKNGLMLNCYPENRLWYDPFILKAINDSDNSFWWDFGSHFSDLTGGLPDDEKKTVLSIYEKYLKIKNHSD